MRKFREGGKEVTVARGGGGRARRGGSDEITRDEVIG